MVTAQDVYEYIAQAGPVLPKHVAEAFGISTLFASAFLSELSGTKKVLTSHLKIGGSPLYYTQDHKDRLVDYRGNLHEKEQKTFALLRSEQVLDDSKLELLDRVALRKMEDFAVPLAVDLGGERRIFWKYYLLSDEITVQLISELVDTERSRAKSEDDEYRASSDDAPTPANVVETPENERSPVQEPVKEPAPQPPQKSDGESNTNTGAPRSEPKPDASAQEPEKTETTGVTEPITPQKPAPQKTEKQERIDITPKQVSVTHAPDASEALTDDPLGSRVLKYFSEKGISVLFAEVPRKNSCLGVCSVPSPIGELEYFFYGKDKKSITDKDVKEAYAEAAILGYPLLYIAKGDVKKTATDIIGNKIKGSIIVEL